MVVYSAVSPFVLSYIILVLSFILATFARFFFDVRLFCCQWVSEYSSTQSNRIVLFFSILFCLCAWFLFVVVSAYVIYDKKIPTFFMRGLLFAFCLIEKLNQS